MMSGLCLCSATQIKHCSRITDGHRLCPQLAIHIPSIIFNRINNRIQHTYLGREATASTHVFVAFILLQLMADAPRIAPLRRQRRILKTVGVTAQRWRLVFSKRQAQLGIVTGAETPSQILTFSGECTSEHYYIK